MAFTLLNDATSEELSEEQLVSAANRGEAIGALPGWRWNAVCQCWEHEDRNATISFSAGSWILCGSDGLYNERVTDAREGMRNELLP